MLFSYKNTAFRGGYQIAEAQNGDWPEYKDSVRRVLLPIGQAGSRQVWQTAKSGRVLSRGGRDRG